MRLRSTSNSQVQAACTSATKAGCCRESWAKRCTLCYSNWHNFFATQPQQTALAALPGFAPRIAAECSPGWRECRSGRPDRKTGDSISRCERRPSRSGNGFSRRTLRLPAKSAGPGVVSGKVRTVQVDRVFRAGDACKSAPSERRHLVDYRLENSSRRRSLIRVDTARAAPHFRSSARDLREGSAKSSWGRSSNACRPGITRVCRCLIGGSCNGPGAQALQSSSGKHIAMRENQSIRCCAASPYTRR